MGLFVRSSFPSGSDNTSALSFWWSVCLFTVCVHLNVHFFFVCCFCCLNTLSYLQSSWPHRPLFPFISYTVSYLISSLCSGLAAFFSTSALYNVPDRFSCVLFLSSLSAPVCAGYIGPLWSCDMCTETVRSLLVPLRVNWHHRLRVCGGSWGRTKTTLHWCCDAGDVAA